MKATNYLIAAFLLVFTGVSILPVYADTALPEGLENATPEQLMAVGYGLMELTDNEKEIFQKTIKDFGDDLQSMITRELRRDASNKERRIKSKVRGMFENLDEDLAPIVTDTRRPAYQIFKSGLVQQMSPQWGGDLSQLPGEIPGH